MHHFGLGEKYVDVIVRRWQDWTGGIAIRCDDALKFNELAREMTLDQPGAR